MRRTILLAAAVALVLAMVGTPAAAVPKEPKGCPNDASRWIEVDYVLPGSPDWRSTGFYQFYWFVGDGAAIQALRANVPGLSEQQYYELWSSNTLPLVDRNADLRVCIWWIGGQGNIGDAYASVVDNNSNANH